MGPLVVREWEEEVMPASELNAKVVDGGTSRDTCPGSAYPRRFKAVTSPVARICLHAPANP